MAEALSQSDQRNANAEGKEPEDQGLGHEAEPSSAADKGVVIEYSWQRDGQEARARNTRGRAVEMGWGVREAVPGTAHEQKRREKGEDKRRTACSSLVKKTMARPGGAHRDEKMNGM